MHHLPRLFNHSKGTASMGPKDRRRSRLTRCNAAKDIEYDSASLSSSLDDSMSAMVTRSLPDRTSFRIEGTEGELDRIFGSLGLSGPEDFAIPAVAWEAIKKRSASDLLPRSRLSGLNNLEVERVEVDHQLQHGEELEQESQLFARVLDGVRIIDGNELNRDQSAESIKSSACCGVACSVTGGIKGARPPLLKPPPSMTLPVIDDACSTWDILRNFGPESAGGPFDDEVRPALDVVVSKREEEDSLYSFTTSNDDDSSSTTTELQSNISPNMRFRRIIIGWEKGELLGHGSFGSVYEGISEDGFFFAVKEVSLLDQGSQGKQSIYQLEQEIALLSQFEHENIVQYYGTDKDESKLYIFLELITKGSLLKLYQKYNLRDSQVSAYTRQILHGLKYLHERDVVHRDIKCANILVDANGSVKLADFGLAKATKLNDVKSCKGTAFWMAPEVVNRRNQGYGLPADIWSLGCTVLEMLTGQNPYSHLECVSPTFFWSYSRCHCHHGKSLISVMETMDQVP
uniref:mitogen-activated protein kinase kinase kinase n=1 Tax=Rhizophora mucronata TaxID=61149 RepID=A0A2P2LCL0_RHIMU